MKRILPSVVVLGLIVALPPSSGRTEVVEEIVATVDGNPITLMDLKQFIRTRLNHDPATVDEDLYREGLDAMISEKILAAEVSQAGIKIEPEEIDAYMERLMAQNRISQEAFLQALKAQGLTPEKYRDQVKRELEKSELVNQRVRSRVMVSPAEVEAYYNSHKKEFTRAEEVRVRHILFPLREAATESEVDEVRKKAVEARERALKGANFGELVREYSDDPAQDGDLGFFGRGKLEPELEETAFALSPGDVSAPIKLRSGFHLLKLEERRSEQIQPLAEVESKIREQLYTTALEERFNRLFREDLRKKHVVEVRKYAKPVPVEESAGLALSRDDAMAPVSETRSGFWASINPLALFQGKPDDDNARPDPYPTWIPMHRVSQSNSNEPSESVPILRPDLPAEKSPKEHRGLPVSLDEDRRDEPKKRGSVSRFLRSLSPF